MQGIDIRKARKAQAGSECREREQDAAEKGFGAQTKDGGAGKHHIFTVDSLALLGHQFCCAEGFGVGGAEDAALGDDGGYVFGRGYVEGGIADGDAVGG